MIYYLGFIPMIGLIILANICDYEGKEFWKSLANMVAIGFVVIIPLIWAITGLMGIK